MPSVHIPGTLLGILLVLAALGHGAVDGTSLLIFITGVAWLVTSLGLTGHAKRLLRG